MLFRLVFLGSVITLLSSCELALFSEPSGSVVLYWSAPQERVNGEAMDPDEIGGYEIRYRTEDSYAYETIVITDPSVEQYSIDGIDVSRTIFEVAVFDSVGIYSSFVLATEN